MMRAGVGAIDRKEHDGDGQRAVLGAKSTTAGRTMVKGRMTRRSFLLAFPWLLAAPSRAMPAMPGPVLVESSVQSPSPYVIRALFLTGQPAPQGGTFTQFSDPSLNNHGDLAFAALSTSQTAHYALYLRTGGHLRTLAASGQRAASGGAFKVFNDVVLNDRGTVVFLGLTDDRIAQQGIFLARAGAPVPIAVAGQQAPSGGVFTDFANPTINTGGTVAFVGRMGGGEAIFAASEGSISPIVLSGQPAPTGGTFQFFLDGSPAQNDRGQIAFVAATTDRGIFGVYVTVGGKPVPVVTTDDAAPVGGLFTEFGSLMLTNAGTVGFVGRTAHSTIREALYVTGRATLVALARQGESVSGQVLTTFANSAINQSEAVVFQLGTPDPIPRAIFLARRTGLSAVVRAGDRSPTGQLFTAFSTPALNDRGEVAFVAETDDFRHGIYLLTPR